MPEARVAAPILGHEHARITAGTPACICLEASSPIPPTSELILQLSGPTTLRGSLAERHVETTRIEARFTCRVSGEYALHVRNKLTEHSLLDAAVTVVPGKFHAPSCELTSRIGRDSRVFQLQAKDAHGNQHLTGGEQLEAAVLQYRCAVDDEGDGTYSIVLPASVPNGPQLLRVWPRDREEHEGEAHLPIYVPRAKGVPARCRVLESSPPVAGKSIELRLLLLDAAGKECSMADVGGVHLQASLGGVPMRLSPTLTAGSSLPPGTAQALAVAAPCRSGAHALLVWHTSSPPPQEQRRRWGEAWGVPAGATVLCEQPLVVHEGACGPFCADRSTAEGALRHARAGEWGAIELCLCDAEGRPFTGAADVRLALRRAGGGGGGGAGEGRPMTAPQALGGGGAAAGKGKRQQELSEEMREPQQEVVDEGCGRYKLRYREDASGEYELQVSVSELGESADEGCAAPAPAGRRGEGGVAGSRGSRGAGEDEKPGRRRPLSAAGATGSHESAPPPPPAAPTQRSRGTQLAIMGPWRLSVTPGCLSLLASMQQAQLPTTLIIGDEFKGEVPLVDRLGNSLRVLPKALALVATLSRVTSLPKAAAARQRSKTNLVDVKSSSGLLTVPPAGAILEAFSQTDIERAEAACVKQLECSTELFRQPKTGLWALRLHAPSMTSGEWQTTIRLASHCDAGGVEPGETSATSEAVVSVQQGSLDANLCEAFGPGLRRAFLGRAANFVIRPRDCNGHARRMARGSPFRLSLLNSPGTIDSRVEHQPDGSFLVTFVPFGAAGTYVLAVTFAGRPIAGSPFRVNVMEPPPKPPPKLIRPATAPPMMNHEERVRSRCTGQAADSSLAAGFQAALCPVKKKSVKRRCRPQAAQAAASPATVAATPTRGANLLIRAKCIDKSIRELETAADQGATKAVRPTSAAPTAPLSRALAKPNELLCEKGLAGAARWTASASGSVHTRPTFSYCRSLGIYMPSSATVAAVEEHPLACDELYMADEFNLNAGKREFAARPAGSLGETF